MKFSSYTLGYLRVGVGSPRLRVADVDFNVDEICNLIDRAAEKGCRLLVLPELAVTGYSCGDLFYQQLLLEKAEEGVRRIAEKTAGLEMALIVGAPVATEGGRLFNCAFFIAHGRVLGVIPKTFLPNTNEFYEERWFASDRERTTDMLAYAGERIPFGTDLLFQVREMPQCRIGVEICEDLWAVQPPSTALALAGATVLVNPSASPEILGKQEYRRTLVQSQSARCLAIYAYASAGPGESSTDLVYSGHSLICENGMSLAESERYDFDSTLSVADVDIQRMVGERHKNNTFSARGSEAVFRTIEFSLADQGLDALLRPVPERPFVPSARHERSERCREIFALQTTALAKRLAHIGCRHAVIGVSGGLDSTLALLVTVKAFDRLGLDRKGVVSVTMPGYGTTGRTRGNAEKLAEMLGTTLRIIPIGDAVDQHFADIGHDPQVHDLTYENSQARERTQILMDIANQVKGLVIGTGDLSELALGWCTYNADHMSMYGVNSGVPKTLVRYLVDWCADSEFAGAESDVLRDICATPVSPELLPPDESGAIQQVTEDHIGPYLLHDFFLFHTVRLQFPPAKVFFLARAAFAGEYGDEMLVRWMRSFYSRFFTHQFKRSCLPDGPKIGTVALSPRGDWRMPSDARADLWLKELDALETSLNIEVGGEK